jgi:hypothetical protein
VLAQPYLAAVLDHIASAALWDLVSIGLAQSTDVALLTGLLEQTQEVVQGFVEDLLTISKRHG